MSSDCAGLVDLGWPAVVVVLIVAAGSVARSWIGSRADHVDAWTRRLEARNRIARNDAHPLSP